MSNKKRTFNEPSENKTGGSVIIIGHYGVAVDVMLDSGAVVCIRVKRKSGHVVGDKVVVNNEQLKRLERSTVIHRRSPDDKIHVIASNLDILGLVVSTVPRVPENFIDCAIAVASSENVKPFIVVNKSDLPDSRELYDSLYEIYSHNIPVFFSSVLNGSGLYVITEYFNKNNYRGAFIGISGVGKSSILNIICPDINLEVGELSAVRDLGRHTTTTSTLHKIPGGGELIDTPGFRDFGVVNVPKEDFAEYFYGFQNQLSNSCKFRNCLHKSEPGCNIKAAVKNGVVSKDRYKTYLNILDDLILYEKENKFYM